MIITITGDIGAGKTTLANKLEKELKYEHLYVGGIFRQMAEEKGISIDQFFQNLADEPAIEHEVDERQAKLMREKDNLIVQARIAWYFAQSSPFKVFNIFLGVRPEVGAERAKRKKENANLLVSEVATAILKRKGMELTRYKMLYGIENNLDPKHYNLVLDTSDLSEDETFSKVLEKIKTAQGAS